jgi:hypothetical protein
MQNPLVYIARPLPNYPLELRRQCTIEKLYSADIRRPYIAAEKPCFSVFDYLFWCEYVSHFT